MMDIDLAIKILLNQLGVVFHMDCRRIIIPVTQTKKDRCTKCTELFNIHKMRVTRSQKEAQSTSTSSRLRFNILSQEDLQTRANSLATEKKALSRRVQNLEARVKRIMDQRSVSISEELEPIVADAITSHSTTKFDSELKQLLWNEQLKQASRNSRGMRWHPTVIRWALTIKNISSGAYNYLRESGFVDLPDRRTLDRYVAYKSRHYGIDTENIDILSKQLSGAKDVVLLHDEIKIDSKLVYAKGSGALIGYVRLDDINDALAECLHKEEGTLATHAICFMARSVCSKVCIPVAHYATSTMTADEIYHAFWGVVAQLEMANIQVRASVSDGASTNRRFFLLHQSDYPQVFYILL